MTSSNLTKGFRTQTINNLNKVLSDVKSFRDDFDPEQLEAMRQSAMEIVKLTSREQLTQSVANKEVITGTVGKEL